MANPAMLAVQQKVQMLQKQGMPAAQIGQILQNEVVPTGAVPLTQLWQLMNYVKANAAQQQAPPPDSVAVQLADKVKQMAMQKMHPLGMVPQMGLPPTQSPASPSGQPGPSAGPPPGVAGLPQGQVGQPGSFAGGGIVSFAAGDVVGDPTPDTNPNGIPYIYGGIDPRTRLTRAQLQQMYATGQIPSAQQAPAPAPDAFAAPPQAPPVDFQSAMQARQQANPFAFDPNAGPTNAVAKASASGPAYGDEGLNSLIARIPKPDYLPVEQMPTDEEQIATAKKMYGALGLGSAAKEANLYADKEELKMQKDEKLDKNLALADAGFKMAMAASQGGATFLGAAGFGGSALAQGLMKAKERQDADERSVEDLKIKAAEAQDQGNIAVYNNIMKELGDVRSEANATKRANAQLGAEYGKSVAGLLEAKVRENAMAGIYGNKTDPILEKFRAAYLANPTEENYKRVLDHIHATNPTIQGAEIRSNSAEEIAAQKNPFASFMQPGWGYKQIGQ